MSLWKRIGVWFNPDWKDVEIIKGAVIRRYTWYYTYGTNNVYRIQFSEKLQKYRLDTSNASMINSDQNYIQALTRLAELNSKDRN